MDKYILFAKTLYLRSEKNYLKEILVGTIISILMCFAIHFYPGIAFMLLLGYFCIYQITCMFENDIFLTKKDIMLFAVDKREYQFLYMINRIFSDTVIGNAIVFIVVMLFLIVSKNFYIGIFWLSCWCSNIFLSSYSNLLGEKLEMKKALIFSAIMVAVFSILVLLYVEENRYIISFFQGKTIKSALCLLGFSMIYAVICSLIECMRVRTSYNGVELLQSLKQLCRRDIMIYKDYVLLGNKLLFTIIEMVLCIFLFAKDLKYNMGIGLFLVGISTRMFSAKNKKKYIIIENDTFFSEDVFDMDKEFLRKSKHRTILSGVLIKTVLSIIITLIMDIFSLRLLFLTIILLILEAHIEYITIYRNNIMTTVFGNIVRYSLIILGVLSLIFTKYYIVTILVIGISTLICDLLARKIYKLE